MRVQIVAGLLFPRGLHRRLGMYVRTLCFQKMLKTQHSHASNESRVLKERQRYKNSLQCSLSVKTQTVFKKTRTEGIL